MTWLTRATTPRRRSFRQICCRSIIGSNMTAEAGARRSPRPIRCCIGYESIRHGIPARLKIVSCFGTPRSLSHLPPLLAAPLRPAPAAAEKIPSADISLPAPVCGKSLWLTRATAAFYL